MADALPWLVDVLQQLRDGVLTITDVVFRAYPALRLSTPKPEAPSTSLGRLSLRRTGGDLETGGGQGAREEDEEEMAARQEAVEEHLGLTIEDALFTSEGAIPCHGREGCCDVL